MSLSKAQYAQLDTKLKELGADPDYGDAMNCDLISLDLEELVDAGFNLDAFLAKQDDFYEMLSEVMSLHKVFIGTGGRIV